MTVPLKLTAQLAEGWLREMGSTPKRAPQDPALAWQFEFDHPPGSPGRLVLASPKGRPRSLLVISNIMVSPEHHAAFQDLDQDEKFAFFKELSTTLNREYVEFALLGTTGMECPAGFQITATRYDDGLTLDSLSRTISSVYKAQLAGISCIQVHLTPKGGGTAGHFDFKRMGGGIQ
jgi:hypothetical protein